MALRCGLKFFVLMCTQSVGASGAAGQRRYKCPPVPEKFDQVSEMRWVVRSSSML